MMISNNASNYEQVGVKNREKIAIINSSVQMCNIIDLIIGNGSNMSCNT